eukprot:m.539774 g.539774  ORF g.539774 m.539774 type:complete len:263 (-) comp57635_c0_seq22:450-1238(-)
MSAPAPTAPPSSSVARLATPVPLVCCFKRYICPLSFLFLLSVVTISFFARPLNLSDMWSAGATLAELMIQKPLFCGRDTKDQLRRILCYLGSPTQRENIRFCEESGLDIAHVPLYAFGFAVENLSTLLPVYIPLEAVQLLESLLRLVPSRRWTAEKALESAFFKSMRAPASASVSSASLSLTSVSSATDLSRSTVSEADSATVIDASSDFAPSTTQSLSADGNHAMGLESVALCARQSARQPLAPVALSSCSTAQRSDACSL